jgi:hypothetical protein
MKGPVPACRVVRLTSPFRDCRRIVGTAPETKVFLLLFLQKKKTLVLFLKKKNQKDVWFCMPRHAPVRY